VCSLEALQCIITLPKIALNAGGWSCGSRREKSALTSNEAHFPDLAKASFIPVNFLQLSKIEAAPNPAASRGESGVRKPGQREIYPVAQRTNK